MPGMKDTFQVINRMVTEGIVQRYAIVGAVAAFNYVESTFTEDLDILISIDELASQPSSGRGSGPGRRH